MSVRNLADGVHLGLEPELYFEEDALGSSDIIRLAQMREGWWWSSKHNPDYRDKRSAALNVGSALHALLLEGPLAYATRFVVLPDKHDFRPLAETVDQMRAALKKAGLRVDGPGSGTSKWSAGDWAAAMRTNLPEHHCWPNIIAEYARGAGERTPIVAVEDRMIRFMVEVATDPDRSDNREIRYLFAEDAGRPALAEVSVFATVDGIRRRYRFDRMFPRFTMDLKSLGAWHGRPLQFSAGEQLARSGWDIQRADHQEGRDLAYQFIREGKVFGGTKEQRAWLERFPDEFPKYDYVWLVYQKPDPKGRAPVIFPIMDMTMQPGFPALNDEPYWVARPGMSELLVYGARKKKVALDLYRRCVAEFGLDRPWARIDTLHYLQEGFEPRVVLPAWIQEEQPTAAEAYEQGEDHDG